MSAEAVAWVWRHSPYRGSERLIHLALADSANDVHGYEIWARQSWIAAKAGPGVRRETVVRWLQKASEDGFIVCLENNARLKKEVGGPKPNRYRLLMPPDAPVVWESSPRGGVTRDHTPRVTTDHRGCDDASHGGVTTDHTEPKGKTQELTQEENVSPPATLSDQQERPELLALCLQLADWVEHNGSKRPDISKEWLDVCRRMIDIDGLTPQQISRAIDWCQKDEFWRANIRSMKKLRVQYDTLRLQAMQSRNGRGGSAQQAQDVTRDSLINLRERHPE